MPTSGGTPTEANAALADDRMMLVGGHYIRDAAIDADKTAVWDSSDVTYPTSGGDLDPTTADDPSASNARVRVYDDTLLNGYSPDLSGGGVDSAFLWGGLSSDSDLTVDIVVIGYDLTSCTFDVDFRIELCEFEDDATLTGNLQSRTIAASDPRTGLVFLALPNIYTGVGSYLLRCDAPGGATQFTSTSFPVITELVIGERRQMGVNPRRPFSIDSYAATSMQFTSESGYVSTIILNRGRWEPSVDFELSEGLDIYGLDNVTTVRNLGSDTADFTRPFAVFPEPSTTPTRGHWMQTMDPGLSLPEISRQRRAWRADWRELPPFYRIRSV